MERDALGLIETVGLVGAIEACDAAAKAAAVVVESAEVTDGTFVTIKFEGELGAVQAAAEAGAMAAQKVGQLLTVHVIPRPDEGLDCILPPGRFINKYREGPPDPDDDNTGRFAEPDMPSDSPSYGAPNDPERFFDINDEKLQAMTVSGLRQFARKLPHLSMKGREISHASKETLITEIKKALGK